MPITPFNPFKWRHYEGGVILLCVRWYLRYPLSFRHVVEMMAERGLRINRSCIWRWVQIFGPEVDKRCRRHLKPTNKSWRLDETYIKVKGRDRFLYRAVDSTGQTIDFLLTDRRDAAAAKRFFRRAFEKPGNSAPRVINVDKNHAYPRAFQELKADGTIAKDADYVSASTSTISWSKTPAMSNAERGWPKATVRCGQHGGRCKESRRWKW